MEGLSGWRPYYPDGYPIRDGVHNPWVTVDSMTGKCAYDVWVGMGRPENEGVLRARLDQIGKRK